MHVARVLPRCTSPAFCHGTRSPAFYSGIIMPSVPRPLPMQVFGFPAGGERTCEREIDRARFGPLDVPRKFATDTWGRRIARPLDPRKVPGDTPAFAQRRDSSPISRTPPVHSSINSRLDNGRCRLPRASGAAIALGTRPSVRKRAE